MFSKIIMIKCRQNINNLRKTETFAVVIMIGGYDNQFTTLDNHISNK